MKPDYRRMFLPCETCKTVHVYSYHKKKMTNKKIWCAKCDCAFKNRVECDTPLELAKAWNYEISLGLRTKSGRLIIDEWAGISLDKLNKKYGSEKK